MKAKAQNTPRRRDRRHRACREGSWDGGGESCWRWGQHLALWRTQHVSVFKCHRCREFFGGSGVNFHPVGAPNSQLLRRSCTHNRYPHATTSPKHTLAYWQKISHRGQFRLRWCSTKLAREGGGSVSVRK